MRKKVAKQRRPQLANVSNAMTEVSISHLDPRLPSLHAAKHGGDTNNRQEEEDLDQSTEVDFHEYGHRLSINGTVVSTVTPDAQEAAATDEENQQNNNDNADSNNKDDGIISLQELIYATSSFHAIVQPVSITMILSALSVCYINTPATRAAGEKALDQTYQVFTISDDKSAIASLGLGLVNSLIIVCAIGGMTFLLVLLYKYRCMKVLGGYMVVASTVLLGFLGGQMFHVAIDKYRLGIDQLSYYFTMYNFAVVGTIAIFSQKGIPQVINQAYLVLTSVIVAWQLSYFNDWMAWTLLIMLALYDLFAVLTPYGPLKALVKLMSKDDAPTMPGLLYEAPLPFNATRPGQSSRRNNNNTGTTAATNNTREQSRGENNDNNSSPTSITQNVASIRERGNHFEAIPTTPLQAASTKSNRSNQVAIAQRESTASSSADSYRTSGETATASSMSSLSHSHTEVPLAIARLYKLPLSRNMAFHPITSLDTSTPTSYLTQQFTPQELQQTVKVKFPRGGGRIESTTIDGEVRYAVYNKDGILRRTLVVNNETGKVMELVKQKVAKSEENNIKLGLGDFIFYSVLVSKAAENSFASFVACFISILMGLGGTLVLLSVYHRALPALPISIFLAVAFFVLTIYCMTPWIDVLWQAPFYV